MRVVQLAAFPGSHRTSFISMMAAISRAVADRGWSPEIFLPAEASDRAWVPDLVDAGAVVEFAPPDLRGTRHWVRSRLDPSEPALLHTHFTGFDMPAFWSGLTRRSTKVVWHMHTVLDPGPRAVLRNLVKLGIGGRVVGGILCPSEEMKRALIRRGAPRAKVHPVPTPIDPAVFPMTDAAGRLAARKALGLPERGVVLLHFGWHWQIKGGDLFVEVVRELRERGLDVVGVTRSGPEAEAHIRRAGMQDFIRVQPPVERASDLFAAADALIASSRGEGMPFSLLEAFCSGTPVVATDIPGHAYVAGLAACRIGDPSPGALAGAVEATLSRSQELARAEAEEARSWVSERLGLEQFAKRVLNIYESVL